MPGLRYTLLCMPDMSEKKSPPRKEKPQYVKTPQSESKGMKRKLIITESVPEDDDKRITPKRKRGLTLDSSPEPPAPRTPGSISRITMPLSERQQMALLMRMTDDNSQGDASPKALSSPPPMSSAKRTPGDKKVNKRNDRGETSLHMAAKRGDIKQTKKLIKAGANVNVKDYAGWTPLHEACNRGMLSVAKQLMKAGANVNVQGFENDTPLHDASINGHQKLVELLLKHGANPLQLNLKGKTPVDVAASPDLEIVLRKEIISSSSDSSSLDDARSPTSPESMSSVKDEDSRTGDEDVHPHSSLKSDTSSSSKRVLIPQSPEKTGSPHICIKFDSDKGQQKVVEKTLVKPYDLTVLTDEPVKNSSRPSSPVSSISDSELYDPHLNSSYVSREPTLDDQLSSSSWLYGKERHLDSEMVSSVEKEQRHELKTQETLPFTPHLYDSMGGGNNSKSLHVSVRNNCSVDSNQKLQQQLHLPQQQQKHIPVDLNSSSVGNGTLSSSSFDGVSQYPVITGVNSGSGSGSYASTTHSAPRTRTQNSHKGVNLVTSEGGDSSLSSSGIPTFSHKDSQKRDESHCDVFSRLGDQSTSGQDGRFLPRSFSPKTKSNQDSKDGCSSPKNHSQPVSPRVRLDRTVSPNSMDWDACTDSPKSKVENESKEIHSVSPKVRIEKESRDSWPVSPRTRSDSNISRSASPKIHLDKESRSSSPKTRSNSRSSSPRLKVDRESRPGSPRFRMDVENTDSRPVSPRLRSDRPVSPRLRSERPVSPRSRPDWPVSPRLRSDQPVSPQLRSDQPVSPRLRLDREAKDSRPVSPKLRSDSRPVSPRSRDSRDSRPSSPRLTRSERESRACSPKVPPLRIILPPKAASAVTKDTDCLKLLLNKPALPYVLNPTQDQQGQEQGEQAEGAQNEGEDGTTAQPGLQGDVATTEDGKMAESDTPQQQGEQDQNKESNSKEESGSGEKEKEETTAEEKERRVTRTLRSHTAMMQQQQNQQKDQQFVAPQKQEKTITPDPPSSIAALNTESGITTRSQKADDDDSSVQSQKRKLRPKSDTAPPAEEPAPLPPPPTVSSHLYEKPPNPFEMFLGIRKQIAAKHDGLRQHSVQPKAPNGYKDYLMVTCTYVLQGNTASTLSVPMLSPPNSVTGPMRDLFEEQENLRYKLRLQHLIEREKLVLSIEQEVLREHGRAARALANQSIPFSVCSILNDEEIYNLQEIEQVENRDKNVRSRYNGRQFFSWLQDVEDKYEKIKEFLLSRHHHEAESLYAVQKMDWQWKMKELSLCDSNATPEVDDLHVPMVHINDEFDLLPS